MNPTTVRLLESLLQLRLKLLQELMKRPDAPDLRHRFREHSMQVRSLQMLMRSQKPKVH